MRNIDLDTVKRSANLLALAERDTVLKRKASTLGGEWKGPCPICGPRGGSDDDGFSVLPYASPWPFWLCRTCTRGKYRSVIDYIALRDTLDPKNGEQLAEICRRAMGVDDVPIQRNSAVSLPTYRATRIAEPPDLNWQAQALLFIEASERQLWSSEGGKALTYLKGERGLNDQTIKRFHLGYNPQDVWANAEEWGNPGGNVKSIWLPRGIVIPCIIRNRVWYIKFRRPGNPNPKYVHIRGGKPAVYNAENLLGSELALITEGEIDAITGWQELGDFMASITFGSSTNLPDLAVFGPYLRQVRLFLLAYDQDTAGSSGEERVKEMIKRSVVCPLPSGFKDLNAFHSSGGDVYQWIKPFLPPV